jgi:hypothetical protein
VNVLQEAVLRYDTGLRRRSFVRGCGTVKEIVPNIFVQKHPLRNTVSSLND